MRRLPGLGLLLILVAATQSACAAPAAGPQPQAVADVYVPQPAGISVTSWVEGLEAPWSLVFLPDGRALVSERAGRIRLIAQGRLVAGPYAELEVAEGGEGGLMGLALHPRFAETPFVYAMHTHQENGRLTNRVIRWRDTGQGLRFDRVVLAGIPGARFHDGGRIGFGPDGMLYVGTGETFQAELAQDRASLGGKVLRLTPEGAVPPDNPFAGSPVFSLGHRNVQGLAWHPASGALFVSEHGPSGEYGLRAHDEINLGQAGGNFGWPRAVGAPGLPGLIDPLAAWPRHTTPPSGMAFWRGDLYVATLRSQALLRLRLGDPASGYKVAAVERWFVAAGDAGRYGRLRDAVLGPDGALYVLTNNRDGRGRPSPGDDRILRLAAAN